MKLKSILLAAALLTTVYAADSYAGTTGVSATTATESSATKDYQTAWQEYQKAKIAAEALKKTNPTAYADQKQKLKAQKVALEKQKEALKNSNPTAYKALKIQLKEEKKTLKQNNP